MEILDQNPGLTKRYGAVPVVDNLNLEVRAGEIFGFLGSNGAGKTTTIRMLTGLLEPSAGQAFICGHDIVREPAKAKALLAYGARPAQNLRQAHCPGIPGPVWPTVPHARDFARWQQGRRCCHCSACLSGPTSCWKATPMVCARKSCWLP